MSKRTRVFQSLGTILASLPLSQHDTISHLWDTARKQLNLDANSPCSPCPPAQVPSTCSQLMSAISKIPDIDPDVAIYADLMIKFKEGSGISNFATFILKNPLTNFYRKETYNHKTCNTQEEFW